MPRRVDRFTIIRELGRGGMGVAYLAYDEQLDRKVAVKLVAAEVSNNPEARTRLLREAQALARLTHPNIVAVHEVGAHDDRVYMAMEFVHGQSLKSWLSDEQRPWDDIVAVFRQAGQGLMAAHEAGLVHRDFKPENVILGDDGRVRVLDFGLACQIATDDNDSGQSMAMTTPESRPLDEVAVTKTGIIWGTPGYVAPEQWRREPLGGQVDQFAFCVSLYEALYGRRPFAGKTWKQMVAAAIRGEVRAVPAGSQVPSWLRAVVLRGLAAEPTQRWPSMAALLAELARDPAQRRRRWLLAAAGVAGVIAAVGVTALALAPMRGQVCSGAREQLSEVWSPAQRVAVTQALRASPVPYAADTAIRVVGLLDGYAEDWADAHTDACVATAIRKEQSATILDQRMACLDDRKQAFGALVEALVEVDDTSIDRAVFAANGLPRIDACADAGYLSAHIKPPDDVAVAAQVRSLRNDLARARELFKLGTYDAGRTIARAVAEAARDIDYRPLDAEIEFLLGQIQSDLGLYIAAETHLKNAFFAARATRYDEIAIDAAIQLMWIVGISLGRDEDAMVWGRHAMAEIDQAGQDRQRVELLDALGGLQARQGSYPQAVETLQSAVALASTALGPDHLGMASPLNSLGFTLDRQGKYAQAAEAYRRALAIRERAQGSHHPAVAMLLGNLGVVAKMRGDYDQAADYYRRALRIRETKLGSDHPKLGVHYHNLGVVFREQGDYDQAEQYLRRALAIFQKAHKPSNSILAHPLVQLGILRLMQGDVDQADDHIRKALAIRQSALGAKHPDTASVVTLLGRVLAAQGWYQEAEVNHRQALSVLENALGKDNPEVARVHYHLGQALSGKRQYEAAIAVYGQALEVQTKTLDADHPQIAHTRTALAQALLGQATPAAVREARVHAAQAVAVLEGRRIDPLYLADARWALARALADSGHNAPEARKLARAVREVYAGAGNARSEALAAVRAWLRVGE